MNQLPKEFITSHGRIEHQRNSSFCSAFSATSYLSAYFAKIYGRVIEFSPLYAMQKAKEIDGTHRTGTYLTDLLDCMVIQGCSEQSYYHEDVDADWNDNQFPSVPKDAETNAKKYKPTKKIALDGRDLGSKQLKAIIYTYSGCLFAMNVWANYFDKYKGIFIKAPLKESTVGRHAIYVCGYDDDLECEYEGEVYKGFFICAESYGTSGISKGYCYMPYKFLDEHIGGFYSADKLIDKIYYFEYDEASINYPNIHKGNNPFKPQREIILKIDDRQAIVNKKVIELDVPAQIINARTYVPFRFLAEAFGCSVMFKQETRTISAYSKEPNYVLEMAIGSKVFVKRVGGGRKEIEADVDPIIREGRTLIPIRTVSELLDCRVIWHAENRSVEIIGRL